MAIDLDVHGNTKPLEAAVQAAVNRIRRQPIKITIDDKGATQPLGNMKRGADEFTKSMEAANARILAFGASMAIINGVGNAFKGMVKNLVEVEKSLADINVVMGLSAQNLDKFSDGLFKVAKETGAAFRVAADAATEYARQGLGVEESLKRTRDALVLTRLTGMDSAEAVKSLTAAMNTYGNQIKDTTQLVSKFAAVDVKFAVSAEDFADAISRTGQSAKTAGVSIDELVGIVTSAQQQTARGGAVIGNALKTIFTKTGRTDTLNQLENLGIAVRDLEGNTLGAKRILSDLANTFDKLSEAQKSQITQTMGGLFHINILKAVLSDAAKQNGIMAEATRISAGATDEAIQKNEELRKTMSAVATETGLAIKQVSAQIGEIALAPGMEKILNTVKSLAEGLSGVLGDGESTGSSFATGFLKGIGNVITGPGLVVLAGVFFKLFGQALKFTKESLTSLVGVTTEKQKQKAIETSLVTLFGQNAALNKEMLRTDIGRVEKERILLALLKSQVAEATRLSNLTGPMAASLYRKGYGANLTPVGKKASGHIPNFANPERAQAAQGGYAAGSIRTMNMPGEGPVIYNSAETVKNFAGFKQPAIMPPQSSKAGKNYQQAFGDIHGFDPYAAGGYIPNFVKPSIKLKNRTDITTPEQAASAGYSGSAIASRFGAQPKSGSKTSDLKNQRFKHINPMGQQYVVLVASEGPDSAAESYFVGNKKMGDNRAYKYASAFKNKRGVNPAKVDVPFYSLDARDKDLNNGKNSPYKNAIYNGLKESGEGLIEKILRDLGFSHKVGKRNILTDRDVSAMGGNVFEGVIASVLSDKNFDNYKSRGETARIDLPADDDLYRLFGVKGGSLGAEAKITSGRSNIKDAALKFYDMLMGGQAASGYIPNFADPLSDAIGREKAAGVPVSQIRVGSHGALMNKSNPLGLGVTNTHDEPNGLRDVFGANGFVPNYATPSVSAGDIIPDPKFQRLQKTQQQLADQYNKVLKRLIDRYEKGIGTHGQLNNNIQRLNSKYNIAAETQDRVTSEVNKNIGVIGKLNQARRRYTNAISNANKSFGGTAAGKAFASSGGQMALMMGLPMAGGFLKDSIGGAAGAGIGGAMTGAATGASLGMMFGPLGTAIGAAAGGLYGFVNGLNEAEEAAREKAKAEREAFVSQRSANVQQGLSRAIGQIAKQEIPNVFTQENVNKFTSKTLARHKPGSSATSIDYYENEALKRLQRFQKSNLFDQLGAHSGGKVSMVDILKPGAITAFDAGSKKGPLDQQISGITEAYAQQMALMQGIESLPAGTKIQSGKDRLSKVEFLEKIASYDFGNTEDLKKFQEDVKNARNVFQESEDVEGERLRGIILQLNIQKAMIESQKATAQAQFDIKKGYLERGNILEQELKLMGGFISEEQKARMKYVQGLNKAGEAYDLARVSAESTKKQGLINLISTDDDLAQKLKISLYKEKLKAEEQAKFQKQTPEEQAAAAKQVELTDELIKKEADRLKEILKQNGATEDQIKKILNIYSQSELNLQLAGNELDLKEQKLYLDKQTNVELGKQADAMRALIAEAEKLKDKAQFDIDLNQVQERIRKALYQMPTHGRGIYRSEDENIAFDRAQLEARIGLQQQSRLAGSRSAIASKFKELNLDPTGLSINDMTSASIVGRTKKMAQERIDALNKYKSSASTDEQLEIDRQITEYQNIIDGKKNDILDKVKETVTEQSRLNQLQDANNDASRAELELREKILKYKRGEALPGDDRSALSRGMSETAKSMREQVKYMDYELGERIPTAFADGLATAMTDAINGTKSIKEGLMDAAISFLGMIQQAMMQKMAYQMVGAMGFSRGGNVRNYSRGGGVPAMVSNGEYVMGRDAVAKYGGAFMHGMNAGGRIPGFAGGGSVEQDLLSAGKIRKESNYSGTGAAGSALAANFGGGRGFNSGRLYQRKAMSGAFYAQSGNVGLAEDTSAMQSILSEEERRRQEAEAKRQAKKAKRRQLLGMVLGTLVTAGLSSAMQGGNLTGTAKAAGYGANTPAGVNMAIDSSGMAVSTLPGADLAGSGLTNITPTRSFNPLSWGSPSTINPALAPFFYNQEYLGGPIRKYASGGHIAGKSGIDQIPAMLSEGEYVIRASSARQIGRPMLDRINAGKFNDGGAVSEIAGSSETGSTGGNTNNINISINMERGSSNQKQQKESESSGKNPADSSNEEQNNAALAERIKQQVVSVIVEEQRPGGLLSD